AAGGVRPGPGAGRRARGHPALTPGAPGARLSGRAGQPRTGSRGARRRRARPGAARGRRGERRRPSRDAAARPAAPGAPRPPRAPLVRRARRFLPPPDAASEPLLATGLATPGEWELAAAAGWLALWLAVAARRRGIVLILLGLVTAACGGMAAREGWHRARPVAVIASAGTPVRVAPYGAASAAITLDAGAALYVERRAGAWLRVERQDGVR